MLKISNFKESKNKMGFTKEAADWEACKARSGVNPESRQQNKKRGLEYGGLVRCAV
jgi:hypothetical protein